MKILKTILKILVGLLAIILVVAAILPKEFHAGSKIEINRPSQEVFDYVKLLKNQAFYDNWSRQDPQIEKHYEGEDGTEGFTYTWKSKKVGDGKQVIRHIVEGKRIDMDIYFNGSTDANKTFIAVHPVDSTHTQVQWEIDGKIPYPFNIMSLFYDMNKDFVEGLERLKGILEK
ncbi:SRPBCC family protein [Sphingobacterium sp. HJSM2_6]|uniref:SRPBCC family protein n=1 Tax=Sphingobacterium sp. HJSM2_6 TaxID=3366264 RepID=UPI003BDD129E